MRRNLMGLAVVLAVLVAGVAYAAASSPSRQTPHQAFLSDVAKRLGVSTAKLQAAIHGAFDDQLTAAVAAGRLTSAQAGAIKQRLAHVGSGVGPAFAFPMAAAVTPGAWGKRMRGAKPMAAPGMQIGPALAGAAPAAPGAWITARCHVKVTPSPGGTSTTTTAPSTSTPTSPPTTTTTANPGSSTSSTTTVVTPGGSTTIITHAGAGGVIIRHGSFRVWRWGRARLACGVHAARLRLAVGFAGGFGALAGGFGALAGGLGAASAYLGLTPAKLISELRSGRSLSQIASAQGKTLTGLRSALDQQLHRRLNRLVAAGILTKTQAQRILAQRSALERAIVSGKASAKLSAALGRSGRRGAHAFKVAPWMAGATPGP
jgi:hypothetical protein